MEHTELKFVTNDLFSLPNIFSQETNYQKMNQTDLNIAAKRSVMRKTFTKDESKMIKTFQMKGPRA